MLTIEKRGFAPLRSLSAGHSAGSTGTILVAEGAFLEIKEETFIGGGGAGSLLVSGGSTVELASPQGLTIGDKAGGTGLATFTGSGSSLKVTGNTIVGDEGTGTLAIAGGASATVKNGAGTVVISNQQGSQGTVDIGAASAAAAVAAGTLNAAAVQFGAGTGVLNLNHTDTNHIFASGISGKGTIAQRSGVTRLTGNASAFTGGTEIHGGSLHVNTVLGGTVAVIGGTLAGSGTIMGDVGVGAATLAPGNSPRVLTVAGNLSLGAGSTLAFELEAPTGTAGTDSDLINVSCNLKLDGTLNVTDAGGFGQGVYRLINYGGALVDNGLAIGASPAGFAASDLAVQTATAGQVNLLVTQTSALAFWDGANTGANGAVDGGSGTWSAAGANWTNAGGTANGVFSPLLFLVFQGTPGTVSVDNGAGQVSASAGMQFAVDGYTVTGGALALSGAAKTRVGDGTAAGAAHTATIASSLTGTGSLEKTDLGKLVLAGTNGYTGGTVVSAGTLAGNAASLQGNIANNAALVFDQATNGTFAGVLSGNGTTTKSGAGNLIFTANSSGFTGITNVLAGKLTVNGLLGGAVNVAGGQLGGSGTLGALTLASGGSLAPGNSIGTLTVAGNVAFASGSTLEVELDGSGFVAGTNNDLVSAAGTAAIAGGTVHVTPVNGTDSGTTSTPGTYTIVTAAGGVSSAFAMVTDAYAFLDFVLGYGANAVTLTSTPVSATTFCLPGMTQNQCATGGGAFSAGGGSALFAAVQALPGATAPAALDLLSGEIHASTRTALIDDSRFVREAAAERVRKGVRGRWPGGDGVLGAGLRRAWHDRRRRGDARPQHGRPLRRCGRRGLRELVSRLLAGYSHSRLDADQRASAASVDSYHLAAFGGARMNDVAFRFGGAYTWHRIDTSRAVVFAGFSDSLTAGYRAATGQLFGELGYGRTFGATRIEPFAGIAWVSHATDGAAEQGGAAALNGSGDTSDATFATLGLRGTSELALAGPGKVHLSGMAGWRHAFADTPTATHSFAGGNAFTTTGVPLARDTLVLEAGLDVEITPTAVLGFNYAGQIGSGVSDHAFKANLGVRF